MDAGAARGLAEDRHVVRVAAELRDVPFDPLERRDLVEEAVVAGLAAGLLRQGRVGEVAKGAEAVVDRNQDHALAGERGSFVRRLVAPAEAQASAVDPDHDGPRLIAVASRRPHVQEQAVLGRFRQGHTGHHRQNGALRTDGAELRRVARAAPLRRRLRRLPAQFSDRRRREGNAAVDGQAGVRIEDLALQLAGVDLDDGGVGAGGRGEEQQNRGRGDGRKNSRFVAGPGHDYLQRLAGGRRAAGLLTLHAGTGASSDPVPSCAECPRSNAACLRVYTAPRDRAVCLGVGGCRVLGGGSRSGPGGCWSVDPRAGAADGRSGPESEERYATAGPCSWRVRAFSPGAATTPRMEAGPHQHREGVVPG